ncbi:MAG: LuxR C-terminal-related transcriptional regulator [Planktotalea sp.]|uniref:helix-turn-helix transcriptional regulator n=1 Tax=Planktotalea sp. TaxID=2029877 RepID=UPI003C766915
MEIGKFSLIDAFDTLSACNTPNEIWNSANTIAMSVGISALNVGEFDLLNENILWARSSMPQSWLDTYMERRFFEVDPLLKIFSQPSNRLTVYSDPTSIANGMDGGDPVLSQALNDAGYALLHGTKFLAPNAQFGTMVTLCFEKIDKTVFEANIAEWTTIAALFAGFSMTPNESGDQNVFAFDFPKLTQREIDVLSLLAAGYKTARIADRLNLAEITVAKHFQSGRKKLKSATREQAVITALKYKLISV